MQLIVDRLDLSGEVGALAVDDALAGITAEVQRMTAGHAAGGAAERKNDHESDDQKAENEDSTDVSEAIFARSLGLVGRLSLERPSRGRSGCLGCHGFLPLRHYNTKNYTHYTRLRGIGKPDVSAFQESIVPWRRTHRKHLDAWL